MTGNDELELYLARFQSALTGMTLTERQDIVEEIRVHVEERLATGMSLSETLARLGPAHDLAREYCRGALVRRAEALVGRARTAFSPWVILRAAFAWAVTGLHGAGVFAIALIGYGLGFAFAACAVLKFFLPEATGLWIGDGLFHAGFPPPQDHPEAQEILGTWFEPVMVGLAAIFLMGTTALMRKLMAGFRYWRASALQVRPEPAAPGAAPVNRTGEAEPLPRQDATLFWMPPASYPGSWALGIPWILSRRRRR